MARLIFMQVFMMPQKPYYPLAKLSFTVMY